MSEYLIAIDGGTTNTRVSLWDKSGQVKDFIKKSTGVSQTAADGNNLALKAAVKNGIEELLDRNGIDFDRIACIYACGMLTSNVGLLELEHLTAPVGIKELSDGVLSVEMQEICPIPICFIRGVKNQNGVISLNNIEAMDIMRGEETETMALIKGYGSVRGCLFVLPGSHTKFVSVNGSGMITGCITSLAGELLSALTLHTILSNAVEKHFVESTLNKEILLAGFHAARQAGFGRAVFLTRILSQFMSKNHQDCASFLLGAVLEGDIYAMRHSSALKLQKESRIVIAGKEPLSEALNILIKEDGFFDQVLKVDISNEAQLSGLGVYTIARGRGDF